MDMSEREEGNRKTRRRKQEGERERDRQGRGREEEETKVYQIDGMCWKRTKKYARSMRRVEEDKQ